MILPVDADFAVELGADDAVLDFPWEDPEGVHRYLDVKRHPELLRQVPEAVKDPELGEFLASVNSSILETAKCDAWASSEISPEEGIFGAAWKWGSYVDLLFSEVGLRSNFEANEQLARSLTQLLKKAPEIPASAEFLIRRCYCRELKDDPTRQTFYITSYVFGFADNEERARKQWAIGLKLVENAIRQVAVKR